MHANQKHNKIYGINLQLILLSDPLHFLCRCFYLSEMNDHNDTGNSNFRICIFI